MKSKITKIQILKRGIAIALLAMFLLSPITYALTTLDDSYLETSFLDQIMYGTVGSTLKEIEEHLISNTTLYITNETQLRAFAEYVNNGNDCSGKEIILYNDIEINDENEWVPIGNIQNQFKGTFNGNNFTISGIKITGLSYSGLFGYVFDGTIINLKVANINITSNDQTFMYCGAIAGYVQNSEIIGCESIDGEIKGYDIVGGIIGQARNSIIDNCKNDTYVNGNNRVGGIVGNISSGEIYVEVYEGVNITSGKKGFSCIKNCINDSLVSGERFVGGIAGGSYSEIEKSADKIKITNCINKQSITGKFEVGGIVGCSENVNIKNCENNAYKIEAKDMVGGIVGTANYPTVITNCKNNRTITTNLDTSLAIGGIVGEGHSVHIEKCVNSGDLDIDNSGLKHGIMGADLGNSEGDNGKIINSINVIKGADESYRFSCFDFVDVVGCLNYIRIDQPLKIEDLKVETQGVSSESVGNCYQSYRISGNLTEEAVEQIEIDNLNKIYKFDKEQKMLVLKDAIGYIENPTSTLGETTVTYTVSKNENEISQREYFKSGDIIKVTATFDKYLAKTYIPLEGISQAPVLKINNKIEMVPGLINSDNSNYTTIIEYTYAVNQGDNLQIDTLDLYEEGVIFAVENQTSYSEVKQASSSAEIIDTLIIDTTAPTVYTTAYVAGASDEEIYASGKEIIIEVVSDERIDGYYELPEIKVNFSESGEGKYYIEETGKVGYAKCIDAKINLDGTTTLKYSYLIQAGDEGTVQLSYTSGKIKDIAGNETDLTSIEKINLESINADTTLPSLQIITDTTNPTNSGLIKYTFKFSEAVKDFTVEDITVNNGKKLTEVIGEGEESKEQIKFEEISDLEYTLEVEPTITAGNEGIVQVIVEEGVCKDLVGYNNLRAESIIKVDRKAPVIESLEAYATSNIGLNKEVDVVKEYYNNEETVTVVATFDENIISEEVPELVLQFSESKNSVVLEGTISGNKIIYTYKITEGDEGTLSVRAFTGTIIDAVGNETKVTKRVLDGDTIIVDTDAPSLKQLNVTTTEGTYNADNNIIIEAVYDEEVYILKDSEVKNVIQDDESNNSNAPVLKIKLGNGQEKTATVVGYGQTDGKEDKTKIKYVYTIVDGDNGVLEIIAYENSENCKVCDIAGNISSLHADQAGNEIIADTIRPQVTNIVAKVEDPIINGVNGDIRDTETGYYKAGNEIKITLTFDEKVSGAVLMPKILVGFSEDKGIEPAEYSDYSYESDWNANSETIEYSYIIKDNDNGYLWVKVPENQFDDEAGNGNVERTANELLEVFADTKIPTVTLIEDTEVNQNNQTIVIEAQFSENVYDLDEETRVTLTKTNAPKLIYSFGNGNNKEVIASSIEGAIITYTINKDPVEDDGILYYELAKGNLCDRAGNLYYIEKTDTTAPVLESVEITTDADIYAPYCKEGTEIYVTATFNEPIKAENIKLKAKIGETEIGGLNGEILQQDPTQVKFTYAVKAGDNGPFEILDICGETDSKIVEEDVDNTYGWVKDEYGNQNNIYNLEDENVEVIGSAIADTQVPTLTITSDEERTNKDIVTYTFSWSEAVEGFTQEDIEVINGSKSEFKQVDAEGKVYTLTVNSLTEGRQIVKVDEEICEDKAGNLNSTKIIYNKVVIDYTKPKVRFISEYNGGVYVIPTNIDKVEFRPNIEIDEEIAKVEYKWDDEEYVQIENYSSSSDIAVPSKAYTEEGMHVLYIKATDLAGNDAELNKTYELLNSNIEITTSTTEDTNQDITATVVFGTGLTDNRKVTFKAEDSNELKQLDAVNVDENGSVQYTIETNGTIYAEATDRVENKVFTQTTITNIDRQAPVIEFSDVPNGILKGEPIDIRIDTDEPAIIEYSMDNQNWEEYEDYRDISSAAIGLTLTFEEAGEYTLYVKATDEAGNEGSSQLTIIVTPLKFEVLGNIDEWTNRDIELYVDCDYELESITVNGTEVNTQERLYIAKENGDYEIVVTDKYGNTVTKTEKVEKIDKVDPVISKIENTGKEITISADDGEGSGIAEYAISSTTEVPVEWSESNVIKTTKDGTFYVWVKDNVGNITRAEDTVTVDTTAPTIAFKYSNLVVTQGQALETNIITDENAIISYNWDNGTWINSDEKVTNLKISEEATETGMQSLYVKATDEVGNESEVQMLRFTIIEGNTTVVNPEIVFEDLYTTQIDGVHYVKVAANMTKEEITNKMDKVALLGKVPEYTKLTEEDDLKTGSEITLDGDTKYIVVVNGDVNSDGKVTPVDVTYVNSIRLNKVKANNIQKLAADFDLDGVVKPVDITMTNSYRLGKIKGI